MKQISFIFLCMCLLLCGCTGQQDAKGVALPFCAEDIQQIELTFYTDDPAHAQQKIVNTAADILSIHTTISQDILLTEGKSIDSEPECVLHIRFCLHDGSGFSMEYRGYGVKSGTLTSDDGDFSHFTAADLAGMWYNIEAEATPISLAPTGATEQPAPQ